MKIIFFGMGSIGQRHARLLRDNYDHELFAFRTYQGQTQNSINVKNVSSWKELDAIAPDVAFITNPTSKHIEVAIECAKRNCTLFIEKPLDSSKRGLDQLVELVRARSLATYVGYNLRFHPVIVFLKKLSEDTPLLHLRVTSSSYLPNWRPDQDHRKSYSSSLSSGGGVILDLSHEIDFCHYLLGGIKKISGQFGRMADLTIDSEDHADILIQSNSGSRANIHINFASHYKERVIKADFQQFTAYCDLINGVITRYSKEALLEERKVEISRDYTYEKQLEYFLKNKSTSMMNNIFEASQLFKKIIDFRETDF